MKDYPIIIVGPAGCGKTSNAQRLADLYGLTKVVDDDERWTLGEVVEPDTLYLCTEVPAWAANKAYVIPFNAAKRELLFKRDQPRHPRGFARIEGDKIAIHIPISAIPMAFDFAFNEDLDDDEKPLKITDIVVFADELVSQLVREEEDGSTPITRLLDAAMEQAVEDGCEGVDFN